MDITKIKWTLAIAVLTGGWLMGCAYFPAKTQSPTTPTLNVTRPQLEAEVTSFVARVEAANADLLAKEQARNQLATLLTTVAKTVVPADYAEAVNGLLVLLTGAAVAEATTGKILSRRKNKV
jgi:outer membrane murein-binding lipoprotein Lpp